jgi:serine/threonine protein kinase
VLLDAEGHIRITDFGLAKSGMRDGERSNSLIGTMEYMAPEVISGSGHGKVPGLQGSSNGNIVKL